MEDVLLWTNFCPLVILIANILENGSLCHEEIDASKYMCRLIKQLRLFRHRQIKEI